MELGDLPNPPASFEIDTADRISPLKAHRTVMDTASASSARLGMAREHDVELRISCPKTPTIGSCLDDS